jgi:Arc/MetJ-type ribon-helix-helix transcriptional regulator
MTTDERITVRLNEYALQVLGKAAAIWPEFDNRSELVRKVIADWDRLRNENGGGRTARIAALETRADDHERRLDLVERHLEATQ